MKEGDALRVRDYLEHIELAVARIRRYLAGLDKASFLASEEKQDAVIRNIEIIGEAAQSIRRRYLNLRRATRKFRGAAFMA
jgi:uncharacterized protein with HEPN domain